MAKISLEGMDFFAHHGCMKEEQLIGTRFTVDLHLETETQEAEMNDDLAKTVNYQTVYGLVAAEMKIRSKLLEHVARRILVRVCTHFPEIIKAEVRVCKLNPPVGGKVEKVCILLRK
ncbi:MAG: dihydroneopterin aldolase [Bacteroidales bacterium]|nr:dihydroneopterin aldolase [Lentimicrobiaceae bacterium]MDD5695460.1 dihydroneopterin aldolase [Bacteroidales bacterium]